MTNDVGRIIPHVVWSQEKDKMPHRCEACGVKCANSSMYADHLRGKKHRCVRSPAKEAVGLQVNNHMCVAGHLLAASSSIVQYSFCA